MAQQSQDGNSQTRGRVNQKRRTRRAIVDAARSMLDRGEHPTLAQAATEAEVSRTTAYRYFPTQESLLLELSVSMSVDEVDALLREPFHDTTPQDRLLELIEGFTQYLADNEMLTRTAQRHYLDTWLAAERAGEGHEQPVRAGRRREWIASALAPLKGTIPDESLHRLQAALCLIVGGEAFTVLRDVCQLQPDEAIGVLRWAAKAMLDATVPAHAGA